MRFYHFPFFILFGFLAYSQNNHPKVTQADIDLKIYEQDTTAHAVVLYEKGYFDFQLLNRQIYLVKSYETKVKIFDDQGFEEANIEIPLYHNENAKETAYDIKGMTHNGMVKTSLNQNDIFQEDNSENWSY